MSLINKLRRKLIFLLTIHPCYCLQQFQSVQFEVSVCVVFPVSRFYITRKREKKEMWLSNLSFVRGDLKYCISSELSSIFSVSM